MNNGFGLLLSRRGNRAIYCGAGIVLFSSSTLVAYLTYFEGNENHGVAMYLLCMSILAMFLGELLRRACLLGEEVCHKRERYEGKWEKLFTKVFSFKNNYLNDIIVLVFFIFFGFGAYHYYNENREAISSEGGRYFLLLFFQNIAIVPIVGYLAGIREPAAVEKSEMNERYNKNIADGLAWSYYFGYLKFILPNLHKAVIRSSQKVREGLDTVKLFILLPKNCYCYESLETCDNRIKVFFNLPKMEINRGGIHKRDYHNTVYEITISADSLPGDKTKYAGVYYCVIEYANPLMSLYEMSNDPNAELSEEERLNQVKLFYNKLKEILDRNPECKGKYELILLADACDDLALTIVKAIKNVPVEIPH